VPKQSPPYPPLAEAIKGQRVFELPDQKGTVVGFWFPRFMSGVNAPGYHFHYLSQDLKSGGHLLDGRAEKVKVFLQPIPRFNLVLDHL
jgi:acetolactate decarboxylase